MMIDIAKGYIKKYPWCPWALAIKGAVLFVVWLVFPSQILAMLWFLISLIVLAAGGFGLYLVHTDPSLKPVKATEKKPEPPKEEPPKQEPPSEK